MSETNGNGGRRLAVYAIPEKRDGVEKPFWPRIGIAFWNRDGSINILLDALPIGTNRLQVREIREEQRPAAARRETGLETVEVSP
ncbi:MAG TPA: hypothetical protein VLT61_03665 [Anaeromyxobacteraceae bacterium]|nr:hypothetical protein [Anaeromyxobacteraceae bacterium]